MAVPSTVLFTVDSGRRDDAVLASPVPYNALINGSWGALLLFGLMPWVLGGSGQGRPTRAFRPPRRFGRGGRPRAGLDKGDSLGRDPGGHLVAFEPFTAVLVVGMVAAIAIGSMLAGWPGGTVRLAAVAGGGLVVAAVLNLPWIIDAMASDAAWDWFSGTRPTTPATGDLDALLRFDTGKLGGAPLGWALPFAGLVPVILARGPRWAWAVRGLCLYLASVALVWASGEGWIGVPLPRPEVTLTVGALGLAISGAMGVAAIERDLRTYKFGWRQLAPVTAVVAVVLAMVAPTLASLNGGWRMPEDEFNRRFAQQPVPDSPQRTLWIGHDDVLAAGGRSVFDSLTVAVTADIQVGLVDRWGGVPQPADPLIAEALDLAFSGGTGRLGRLLAPFGIGEIAVLERSAPAPSTGVQKPVPDALLAALTEQLDLAELELSPGVTRYRNTAALPVAALVPDGATSTNSLRQFASSGNLVAVGALQPTSSARKTFVGPVTTGQEVYLSVPATASWRLSVNGQVASRSPAFDWATAYQSTVAGDGDADPHHLGPSPSCDRHSGRALGPRNRGAPADDVDSAGPTS